MRRMDDLNTTILFQKHREDSYSDAASRYLRWHGYLDEFYITTPHAWGCSRRDRLACVLQSTNFAIWALRHELYSMENLRLGTNLQNKWIGLPPMSQDCRRPFCPKS
ncbi:hypothetical protein FRB94_009948 [Tulasnella sp. JGI-2019a]|nr:hypothetical protein FRB94_009948 [Tulasnella sp. JGI-2019a]